MKPTIFLAPVLLFALSSLKAQNTHERLFPYREPKHYVCYQTPQAIECDGKLEEEVWKKAEWSDDFIDIEGCSKPKPYYQTRMKMLYDKQYLYVAAQLEEKHIWSYLTHFDDIVYHDNDFEVFIDPTGMGRRYFEIEVNAQNTIFDLFLERPYRFDGHALIDWDLKGLKTGIKLDGSLNNGLDQDKHWTVEMAIPLEKLKLGYDTVWPRPNSLWRINFSRVEWNTEYKDGRYIKKNDPVTHTPLPENNWVWTAQGAIDMHRPEKWGYLQFAPNEAGKGDERFKLPYADKMIQYLWWIFQLENDYYSKKKSYTEKLEELGAKSSSYMIDGSRNEINIDCFAGQFSISISCPDRNMKYLLNNNGELLKLQPNE